MFNCQLDIFGGPKEDMGGQFTLDPALSGYYN